MRSRFTAFALAMPEYLLASWHPSMRPATLDLDPMMRWTRLDVLDTTAGGPFDTSGTVTFRAWWRTPSERGELHERSRFVREAGRWSYVDGVPG